MIKLQRGQNQYIDPNLVLEYGQPMIEYQDGVGSPRLKVGDGSSPWESLPYLSPSTDIYKDDAINFQSSAYISLGISSSNKVGMKYDSSSDTLTIGVVE